MEETNQEQEILNIEDQSVVTHTDKNENVDKNQCEEIIEEPIKIDAAYIAGLFEQINRKYTLVLDI